MNRALSAESLAEINARLGQAHNAFARQYPGPSGARQAVHTVYGGAHLFRADTARRLGELALRSLDEYAPDYSVFSKALDLPGAAILTYDPDAFGG
ncbi:MAG: DUF6986 family protein, partial [Candidatus Acidiferrales bacterium]